MTEIEKYLTEKVIDVAVTMVTKSLAKLGSESKVELLSSQENIQAAIERHLVEVKNWASEVTLADFRENKRTSHIFVPLDCYVIQRNKQLSPEEANRKIPMESLFKNKDMRHYVFVGNPGSGKTTSMRNLCLKTLNDRGFCADRINYPIILRLREFETQNADSNELIEKLFNLFGLAINMPMERRDEKLHPNLVLHAKAKVCAVCDLLDNTKALLILDGLDEVLNPELRSSILGTVRTLTMQLEKATIVLTSRTGEYMSAIENMRVFEISPLSLDQIDQFANRFFKSKELASKFLEQVQRIPLVDNTIKPLTLAYLCAVFERVGFIPEKLKTVYRKVIQLLIAEWDEQRSVRRVSRYAKFENDRKYDYLAHLSYELTVTYQTTVFSTDHIVQVYKKICMNFGLPANEANHVTRELESHTGLFVQAGETKFEFAHKSLQEYLAAEFLVRLPSIPAGSILLKLPNELAIATAISSNSSLYLAELVLNRFSGVTISYEFLTTFATRLILEKPDFTKDRSAIYALLGLSSLFHHVFNSEQSASELHQRIIAEIETVIVGILEDDNNLRVLVLQEIVHSYQLGTRPRQSNHNDRNLQYLKKVHNTPIHLSHIGLPKDLIIRQPFYEWLLRKTS